MANVNSNSQFYFEKIENIDDFQVNGGERLWKVFDRIDR